MSLATLSRKGQLVIPKRLRQALHLRPGSRLSVNLEDGRLVLQPERESRASIVTTRGRRLLVAPSGAPAMTTREVKKAMAEFP